jgi:ribonucleotide reductase beta subunit family protein with ferritin-like domain
MSLDSLVEKYNSLIGEGPKSSAELSLFIKNNQQYEPILQENKNRFTMKPIRYNDIYQAYKNQQALFWTAEEIAYTEDMASWATLTEDEKYFIEHVLAFFAGSDGIVMENIMINFSDEVQIPEARAFYAAQNYIEQVHSETYSNLIDTFIKDPVRKDTLFNAISNVPCITKKAEWAMKWFSRSNSFAERLVAFSVVEGIFFSGSFCAIFWLKSRSKMTKALGSSNELIARDESVHCNFAITLYNHLIFKLSKERIQEIFKSAVDIEIEFIIESLPCRLIGMNSNLMTQYIKYVADYWLNKYQVPKIYNVENPFNFMNLIALDGKTNFFEQRVTEYQKPYSVSTQEERSFNLDDNF